ncbi:MAG: hypothetical protein JST16_04455 [Bdellovibrionales bacterium]|nr:hypothetical protein [Bdellovibrionales bacterium]
MKLGKPKSRWFSEGYRVLSPPQTAIVSSMTELDTWSYLAAQTVCGHELNFFHETDHGEGRLTFHRGPITALGDLAQAAAEGALPGMPAGLLPALAGRYANEVLFEPFGDLKLGTDFHDHIADLVSGRRQDLMKVFSLGERGRNLLQRGVLYSADVPSDKRKPHKLVLKLSNAAEARLIRVGIVPRTYRLAIEDIKVFVFSTGKGLTQTRVTVRPETADSLSPLELLEIQIALGRFNEICWLEEDRQYEKNQPKITFGTLIRALVVGPAVPTRKEGRVSTWTFLQFDKDIDKDRRNLMECHFARHYTSDYVLSGAIRGITTVRDFDTVGHTFALEGACTTVAAEPAVGSMTSFLKSFKENTFHKHYLPLMLMALHEQRFLIDRTSRSAIREAGESNSEATLGALRALRSDSLVFRLVYRLSTASFISMHNSVSLALRKVFFLDSMLQQLAVDVSEAENMLQNLADRRRQSDERRRERRFYFPSIVASAALAALTAFQLLEGGFNAFTAWRCSHAVSFVVAIAILLAVMGIGWRMRSRTKVEDEASNEFGEKGFTIHAALEHMLDRCREQ